MDALASAKPNAPKNNTRRVNYITALTAPSSWHHHGIIISRDRGCPPCIRETEHATKNNTTRINYIISMASNNSNTNDKQQNTQKQFQERKEEMLLFECFKKIAPCKLESMRGGGAA
jgi:hypothetical protein